MNIMMNSYCNLKCPYCFADNEINLCEEKSMTEENFDKIIELLKNNNVKDIRLIGGEPTLHPMFGYFLTKLVKDDFFEHIHFFSNMTFGKELRELIINLNDIKGISILPNFNHVEITGNKFELIKENIKLLYKCNIVDSVGINIYKPDQDLSHIYDIVKELKIHNIRWVIVSPNHEITKEFDVKQHFRKFYDKLIEFFDFAIENKCNLRLDCSDIPICAFSKEEAYELMIRNPSMLKPTNCGVVLDINTKLEAFRCFGMSNNYKTQLNTKSKISTIENLIKSNIDDNDVPLFSECTECPKYKMNGNKSCGCMVYRVNKMEVK